MPRETSNLSSDGRKRFSPKLRLATAVGMLLFAGIWGVIHRQSFVEMYRFDFVTPPDVDPLRDRYQFDLSESAVPSETIQVGAADIDSIPALTNPPTVAATTARLVEETDEVIGVVINGEARAYPIKILARHEVVNDRVGGTLVAVTYCPLCDSSAVFDRKGREGEVELGVSGMLFKSNVLFYNRTDAVPTLWSQLWARELTGGKPRRSLEPLPVEVTTWGEWRSRHPSTQVLSHATGYDHDYTEHPYDGYLKGPNLRFPVFPEDREGRLPSKQRVLGIWDDAGDARAYSLATFTDHDEPFEFQDDLAGKKLTLAYTPEARSLRVVSADEGLHWMYALWFAWYAFRSHTDIYAPPEKGPNPR